MKTILVLLVAAVSLAFAPSAAADGGAYVYVAGECHNGDGSQGGTDSVGIDESGNIMILGGGDPGALLPGGGGATDAALWFATQSAMDGGQTGQACEANGTGPNGYQTRGDTDHVQVTAGYGDVVRVTVCYDGSAHVDDGFCPRYGSK